MHKKTFGKILIANRGEIALRIIRTCRAMGIRTIAICSDADKNAPHARMADETVQVGAAPPGDSYLHIGNIIGAARRGQADAIHPGYGFLSENAGFAEACAAAGIVFIGPAPATIRAMGLKSPARKLVAAAGVPVVPGYDGDEQDDVTLRALMLMVDFPIIIKASAGGGGRGMRVVRVQEEALEAIASARREAVTAFGNGTLLLEKYIENARHVEVQILGDQHGHIVHLFERDCSLQRRHQKIIEESPSPAVTPELREQLGAAAVTVGRIIGYQGAGTVEFILAPDGSFYFIEVNTRLQVEHPVTEMVTGLDLVRLQIEIAEGHPLPFTQAAPSMQGHAIEARLYAEDPDNGFLPATGTILDWHAPVDIDGLRIDAGVGQGSEIGIHYDPMLAKVIAHAADRETALRKLSYALRHLSVQGLTTNREFLIRLLEHDTFRLGQADTGFIGAHLAELTGGQNESGDGLCVIAVAMYEQNNWRRAGELTLPPGWRNNPWRHPSLKFRAGARDLDISWRHAGGPEYVAIIGGQSFKVEILDQADGQIRLAVDGVQTTFRLVAVDDKWHVHSPRGAAILTSLPRYPDHAALAGNGAAESPMPGQVLKILVTEGQTVKTGDALVILEAMKMEQTIRAGTDGVVESIRVRTGQIVSPGDVLVRIGA
ncbi:MAG: biotin carboxylase N-terminal domain-containing protein [Blastocatellia bacterium]